MLSIAIFVANAWCSNQGQIGRNFFGSPPYICGPCDSSNEDETIPISVQPSNFSLLDSIAFDVLL
jgi:hypothetical protein